MNRRNGFLTFLATNILFGMACAHALTITSETKIMPGIVPGTSIAMNTLRLTGMFELGDSDRLRGVLKDLRGSASSDGSLATAELSSTGGDVTEGVKVGYLFREFRVSTLVRKGDICLSACALAFLGGTTNHPLKGILPDRRIDIGGEVGSHNISLNLGAVTNSGGGHDQATTQGFNLALGGSALIASYVADMGIKTDLVGRMLGRPVSQFEYIGKAKEFLSLDVCPTEPVVPRVSREQQAANICNNSMRARAPATALQALAMTAREARIMLLQHIEKNAASLGVSDRYAEGLRTVIASRNDRLVSQVYNSLKALGLPLPQFAGNTYAVQGYTMGMYQMTCAVSLSTSEPDQFDLVVLGPKGLAAPANPPPESCRWLYRFDREDMINPPK